MITVKILQCSLVSYHLSCFLNALSYIVHFKILCFFFLASQQPRSYYISEKFYMINTVLDQKRNCVKICCKIFLSYRFTLRGHSAPADQIRMEEHGKRCLTYDSKGRDRSVRVWDVTKGKMFTFNLTYLLVPKCYCEINFFIYSRCHLREGSCNTA